MSKNYKIEIVVTDPFDMYDRDDIEMSVRNLWPIIDETLGLNKVSITVTTKRDN